MEFKDIFRDRIKLLEMTTEEFAEKVFMSAPKIEEILDGIVKYSDIDRFYIDWFCSALHCDENYFEDKEVRKRDLVNMGRDSKLYI